MNVETLGFNNMTVQPQSLYVSEDGGLVSADFVMDEVTITGEPDEVEKKKFPWWLLLVVAGGYYLSNK